MEPQAQQYIGTDDAAGVEYLLTIWPDGGGEITTRAAGWPGSWGPPVHVEQIAPPEAVAP